MIKKLIYTLGSIASVLLLLFFLLFSLTTQQGTRFTIKAITKIIPDLSIGSSEGILTSNLTLKKFHFKNKTINLYAENLELAWDINKLFAIKHKLHICKLKVSDANLKILSLPNSELPYSLVFKKFAQLKASLPFSLQLDRISISSLKLQTDPKTKPLSIDEINFQTYIEKNHPDKIDALIKFAQSQLQIKGRIGDNLQLTWRASLSDLNDLKQFGINLSGAAYLSGNIIGPLQNPNIDLKLNAKNLTYKNNKAADLRAELGFNLKRSGISKIKIDADQISFSKYKIDKLIVNGSVKDGNGRKNFSLSLLKPPTITAPVLGKMQTLSIESFAMQGTINDRGLHAHGFLKLPNLNSINLSLSLPKYTSLRFPIMHEPVKGEAVWQSQDLGFLQSFISGLKNPHGLLTIDSRLDGYISNPAINANLRIKSFHCDIPNWQLHLFGGELDASTDGSTAAYNAKISSGKGQIKILGKTEINKDGFPTTAYISGENFLIADTPSTRIISSPKLNLKFADNKLEICGSVFVPEAAFEQNNYSDIVVLPKEIVYVGKDHPKTNLPQIYTHTRIELNFGDKVDINVMNLHGKLHGSLKIDDLPNNTLASGTLSIKKGTFHIYGQSLKLTKSYLHFINSPITDPRLDIEASRSFQAGDSLSSWRSANKNLTVGIRIQGDLGNPKTTLFSSPNTLSNADIFSYLIIGQASSQASQDNLQLVLSAAQTLNFGAYKQLDDLIGQLRKKLGLSKFGLESQSAFHDGSLIQKPTDIPQKQAGSAMDTNTLSANTAFVLGKYLSPRLYIGYNYRILEQANVFKVNYKLSKSLSIQSESSKTGNSVDLIYRIEKD